MLIVAFKYLMDTMPRNSGNIETLRKHTVYGADLTKTASIAKMNMILAGDGHNNVCRQDSLAHPVDKKFDIVITNMPFAQKTRFGDMYDVPNRNGDIICPQNCFRALADGGRIALIVPEGFLVNTTRAYMGVRELLLKRAKLKTIVSLPRGAFEPYNRAKANILYFTDVNVANTDSRFWSFDVRNDGYTLDKRRKRINGDNDLELVLSENNPDKQSPQYLSSLGVTGIDISQVKCNRFILAAAHYRQPIAESKHPTVMLGDILEPAGQERIGNLKDAPILSLTMEHGLVDQSSKFKKRIASSDISQYKKVLRNELAVWVSD